MIFNITKKRVPGYENFFVVTFSFPVSLIAISYEWFPLRTVFGTNTFRNHTKQLEKL